MFLGIFMNLWKGFVGFGTRYNCLAYWGDLCWISEIEMQTVNDLKPQFISI